MTEQRDIAVVHWQDGGIEKKARAYTIQMLSQLIETMNKRGFTYWVCLTQLDTIIPVRPHKPVTVFLPPNANVDRLEVSKHPHRAFREVTRIEPVHHPPIKVTIEQVKKAYGG